MTRILIGFILALAAGPAFAADIYVGTVGPAEVVVALNYAEAVEGRYFYRSTGRDLYLSGTRANGVLTLEERGEAGPDVEQGPVTGLWRLRAQGRDLVGEWRARRGAAARPVTLRLQASTPADVSEPPAGFVARNVGSDGVPTGWGVEYMPYNLERARTPSSLGPERRLGVGAFRMVRDPRSGVAWPRLTRFPDAAAMARLNTVFEENRAIAIADVQDCRQSAMALSGRDVAPQAPTIEVTMLGARMIALRASGSMFCGGAHPNNFTRSFAYDVRNAAPLDVGAILRLDTEAEQLAFERFWTTRLRARQEAHPDQTSDCNRLEGDYVPQVTLYPSPRGVVVEYLSVASVDAGCVEDLIELPLADLAPFLTPGGADYWR